MKIVFSLSSLAVVIYAGLLLTGCNQAPAAAESVPPPTPKIDGDNITLVPGSKQIDSLTVETAVANTEAFLPVTGRVTLNDETTVRVYTPVAGRVAKIVADVGQVVAAHDPLAIIDSPDFGQSQSDAAKADSDVRLAQKVLARDQDLLAHGAAAAKDIEADQADLESKQVELKRAVAVLEHYGGKLGEVDSHYTLSAPIGGTIVDKNINPGQQLRDDAILANIPQGYQPLFVISDPDQLWLYLDTSEDDVAKMKVGQKLIIHSHAYKDKTFSGVLQLVGEELDPTTRTLKVRALVDNHEHLLRAEMYVTAELEGVPTGGVVISSKDTFRKDGEIYVFVAKQPGQYERRKIQPGSEENGQLTVLSGLAQGDQVVKEGALSLEQAMEGGG